MDRSRTNHLLTLDGPRVFWFGGGHVEGNPPQCPLNPFAFFRLSSRRVEVKRIIYLFRLFGRLGTCVIWDCNDESHQSRLAVKRHTSSVGFGKHFQVACLVREKMDSSTSRFRVFSVFLLVLDALLERWWMCRGPDLGFFSFLFHSCVAKASMFLSSAHMFRCRCAGAMRAILPLSLAKRLAL